jgi:hypothetical protein
MSTPIEGLKFHWDKWKDGSKAFWGRTILEIGDWVHKTACCEAASWPQRFTHASRN